MPGLDSYTKLLLHCNGVDGSTNFPDASENEHVVTANADAQIDTAQSKFGGASGLFDGVGDFLSVPNSSDWDFGTGNFTIDFWIRRNGNQGDFCGIIGASNTGLVGWELSFGYAIQGSTNKLRLTSSARGYWEEDLVDPDVLPNTTWCHVALVRNGNLLSLYVNGISKIAINVTGFTYNSGSQGLTIGKARVGYDGLYISAWVDELRVSKGVARWTSNFTPPTEEYGPDTAELTIFENVNLSDSLSVEQDPLTELISLSESWIVSVLGTIKTKFQTKLYTSLQTNKFYFTDLRTVFNSTKTYNTKLYTQAFINNIYNTDLRVRYDSVDDIVPKSLDDILVKLDGIELVDVDYTSLIINLNLNITPSNAQFILARRHDNLDKTLDNVTSIITNENKVEVFDGSRKLFTGYISQIDADSTRDVVKITASDCRLKMSRESMELKYGGAWLPDSNHNGIPDEDDTTNDVKWPNPDYIKFEKNISQAFEEVMTAVGSLLSGHDSLPITDNKEAEEINTRFFVMAAIQIPKKSVSIGSFVPEYIKSEKDYVSLIDELIRQTANCNWYIDANERLCFQKIGSGSVKSLPLASLNSQRHLYDLIIDNVQLNRPSSNYAQSLIVKRGKKIIEEYQTRIFNGWEAFDARNTMLSILPEKTFFMFHSLTIGEPHGAGWGDYTGIDGKIVLYINIWNQIYLIPTVVVQWLKTSDTSDLPDIKVGSGLPTKTIYLTSYGTKNASIYINGIKYSEDINPDNNAPYFTEIKMERYDQEAFCLDLANFELSQNNKLNTSATLSLILDAYEYYDLSFKDLINLSNTIQSGIYKNNNGFPLNIESVQINCATRTVNMNLTNYGKSYYVKSANYLANFSPFTQTFKYIKKVLTTYDWNHEPISTE